MKRLLVLCLMTDLFAAGVLADDMAGEIPKLVEQRAHGTVIERLRELQARDEKLFTDKNYDYLLARSAESDGQIATAMVNYQAVVRRDSPIAPLALVHLSRIARSTGNLLLERLYLSEIAARWPHSLPAREVPYRLARNAFEAGNYPETVRILTGGTAALSGDFPAADARHVRESTVLLGEAYLAWGRNDEARRIFTRVVDETPEPALPDDAAIKAVEALDVLDRQTVISSAQTAQLTEAEHLRRAEIYQFDRQFSGAKMHYDAILARFGGGGNAAAAIFGIGRGYVRQNDFAEALKWFERLLEQFPEHPLAKDALLQAAAAYSRVGKPKESLTRYQTFIDRYPDDERLDRAYLNTVDALRDQGSDQDALKWCAKTRDAFPGEVPAALATFAAARIHIARSDWEQALAELDQLTAFRDLGGAAAPGGTTRAEAAFLRAFSNENLKRFPEAIDQYLSIDDGRNEYYGWRATLRLEHLMSVDEAAAPLSQKTAELTAGTKAQDADTRRRSAMMLLRIASAPVVRENAMTALRSAVNALPAYSKLPDLGAKARSAPAAKGGGTHRELADRLMVLGLYDEAAFALDAAEAQAAIVADAYKRGDGGDRAIAFIEPLWRKMPADYPIELIPREHLEFLYPAPYADEIVRTAAVDGVDPRLILAIMRQESRFSPDARSGAAARGLMQFISPTSEQIAGRLGYKGFEQNDLYYPPTSIVFGSKYLSDLFVRFPLQPEAVAASYNGGDDNVKRWVARAGSNLPERYVPEIAYAQSKDYVYKVMASYRMYEYLYDEELRKK
ncbi:MAG: transglycosylase SLT domain-containing protein [Pyrinomonadaceae bacterium]